MKKEKYNIDKELKPYTKIKTPLFPFIVVIFQKLMSILYIFQRSDRYTNVIKRKVNADNKNKIKVLIYGQKNVNEKLPCMYFIHGGGFVFNSAPHHFKMVKKFAKELNIKVILVNYRLAPKNKFPIPLLDCFNVYKWILSNKELNIDTNKIIVAGDSAGGNLSTSLCLMANEQNIKTPLAQMLFYPVLDKHMNTKSYKEYQDTPLCNSKDMEKYFNMYLKDLKIDNYYLSPIDAKSFKNMPITYIEVAEFDCLHDEGILYANKLENENVKVELHEIKNAMHGYDIATNSSFMNKINNIRFNFIKNILN